MAERTSNATLKDEYVFTRLLDAPRSLVFKMWTDANHLAAWWGPHCFTNPRCEVDARPGGAIHIDMKGPDGTVYPMTGEFREVVEPERLVFLSAVPDGKGGNLFEILNTVTFADESGKTRQTLTARVVRKAPGADMFLSGMEAGWGQSLERLEAHTVERAFLTSHTFDAPRELVWKAWTERDRLMQWFGPQGFAMTTANLDFRPGGSLLYCLKSPDGNEMWGKFTYREIDPPHRIVWLHQFSDKDGGLTRHPFSETWPLLMLTTATFDEHDGKTTVTIRWSAINPTPEERATFDSSHDGMRQGWGGTFDQLHEYLPKS